MILIYSDSQILDLEWIPHLLWSDQIQVCHDIQEYVSSDCKHKIAFTGHRLHVTHDADMEFEKKIVLLSVNSRLVFTIESELHPFHFNIWGKCHRPNVYWVMPGAINGHENINDHIIYWGDWFKTTANLYRNLPDVLETLHAGRDQTKFFEALLGSPKPHRDFVANSVVENDLRNRFIMTYGGQWQDDRFYARDYFIYEPGTELVDPDQHVGTMDWARYRGHQCHLSQIIPVSVYNDTHYSIIAETDYVNPVIFFSEKTAKPILAKRLFIVFSGYKFLHNLRILGFKTFHGTIDESYDLISNNVQRWMAAFEQIKYLCQSDPREIKEKIQPILDHNFNLMMERDWTQYSLSKIQQLIDRDNISAQR